MRKTTALCPVCLKRLPALRKREGGNHYLIRTCPEHGMQKTVIWRGTENIAAWTGSRAENGAEEGLRCPDDCGLCKRHLRGTCCTLLEVSNRCDLNCRFCFAEGGTVHHGAGSEPTKEKIKEQIDDIVRLTGGTLLQLSGGEPTMRDDLPELVAYALDAGCP
ncbi:MAG: radical SAM protein, partial [Butyrivibrio sp.]|nr:radical SAM protein [Butyrivibrio sp.]